MKTIQILGTGCPKCKTLYHNAEIAVGGNPDIRIEKITSILKIMRFDVLMLPALAIDGRVVSSGRIPTSDEITKMLNDEQSKEQIR